MEELDSIAPRRQRATARATHLHTIESPDLDDDSKERGPTDLDDDFSVTTSSSPGGEVWGIAAPSRPASSPTKQPVRPLARLARRRDEDDLSRPLNAIDHTLGDDEDEDIRPLTAPSALTSGSFKRDRASPAFATTKRLGRRPMTSATPEQDTTTSALREVMRMRRMQEEANQRMLETTERQARERRHAQLLKAALEKLAVAGYGMCMRMRTSNTPSLIFVWHSCGVAL